jgi:hypothetical protein
MFTTHSTMKSMQLGLARVRVAPVDVERAFDYVCRKIHPSRGSLRKS